MYASASPIARALAPARLALRAIRSRLISRLRSGAAARSADVQRRALHPAMHIAVPGFPFLLAWRGGRREECSFPPARRRARASAVRLEFGGARGRPERSRLIGVRLAQRARRAGASARASAKPMRTLATPTCPARRTPSVPAEIVSCSEASTRLMAATSSSALTRPAPFPRVRRRRAARPTAA